MSKGLKWGALWIFLFGLTPQLKAQEITVVGSQEEALALLEADRWWAERKRGQQLKVPHKLILAITERWRESAPDLPVQTKKEIFFAALLPLVVHANAMVLERRERIKEVDERLAPQLLMKDWEVLPDARDVHSRQVAFITYWIRVVCHCR
jgi:hypothetical protein